MQDHESESQTTGVAAVLESDEALDGFFLDVKTSIRSWFGTGPID